MALSGDIEVQDVVKPSAIRLEAQIWFTNDGQITRIAPTHEDITLSDNLPDETIQEVIVDRSKHHLRKVIHVAQGDLESALPLIGHRMQALRPNEKGLEQMLVDGLLTETEEVKEHIAALGPRSPASLLVAHETNIYGVVINGTNEARVVGRVRHVIPKKSDTGVFAQKESNTVVVGKEPGVWEVIKSRDHELKTEVNRGVTFCMISEDGFALIEGTEIPDEEYRELVMIVNRGYIFFKEVPIDWMRLMIGLRIDEFSTRTTRIKYKECLVTQKGAYIRDNDKLQVYGSQNAVLDFDAFLKFLDAMGTVGFQSEKPVEQMDTQMDIKEEANDDNPDECSQLESAMNAIKLSEDLSETKTSVDSEYDNISPDSFS